jgi:ATP-dependent Clp protease ATP-binding subunit ClpX
MESVLLDSMYKIPSLEIVSKVVIDAAVIEGESEPLLLFENTEASNEPAGEEKNNHA